MSFIAAHATMFMLWVDNIHFVISEEMNACGVRTGQHRMTTLVIFSVIEVGACHAGFGGVVELACSVEGTTIIGLDKGLREGFWPSGRSDLC
jgi:hypothetical protein